MKKLFLLTITTAFFLTCKTDQAENQASSGEDLTENQNETSNEEEQFSFEGCFQLEEVMEGSKTTTLIILEIEGTDVFGEEAIEMTGNDYNAVAAGSFEGTYLDGVINVIYEYEIEGNERKEEQEFMIAEEGLLMTKSALRKKDGVLTIMQKGLFNKLLPKIECP